MCGVDPGARCLEEAVVPGTEEVGVVPDGIGVVADVGAGIAAYAARRAHRQVHPEAARVLDIGHELVGLVVDEGAGAHVGACELYVERIEAGGLELGRRGHVAPGLLGIVEEVEDAAVGERREIEELTRGRGVVVLGLNGLEAAYGEGCQSCKKELFHSWLMVGLSGRIMF